MKLRYTLSAIAFTFAASAIASGSDSDLKEKSMEMLYQYMPAADAANYSRDYFEHNVDLSLKARREMPWGLSVPEREFLHFVIPVRVNNEDLDNHREVFYNELKERVKGLSMKDAILEINHWCHEKVTYQPSDARTHSPLASVSSAIGRCGEESTFGVAALRAMGIPARQVYTPRWAHTDDNHAWVEAWADGQWYFLGACEPEPVLNLGWFNAPASRGMLMHARVFGPYEGSEEILSRADGITDINVTDHYAPVDTLWVTVTDHNGKPIEGAKVSFRIYNYAEFYPIATKITDKNGSASIVSGLGDMLVWATDGHNYAYTRCNPAKKRREVITLASGMGTGPATSFELDIIPPAEGAQKTIVTDERLIKDNTLRFAREDSIRAAYVATFITANTDNITDLLAKSRGNHAVISDFITASPDKDKAIALLQALSEKDLTDVTAEVLRDHFATATVDTPLFAEYIMSPRIAAERLTPFRSYLSAKIPASLQASARKDPSRWVKWVKENIDASENWYPISVTMDPARVWDLRKTSPLSRDIFFVASARSMGIPARIDPVTTKPQWADKACRWHDADFSAAQPAAPTARQHRLTIHYTPNGQVEQPLYYTHFSVSKITGGEPQLLNYPDFIPLAESFEKGEMLDAGVYMIVTGQRLANGGVLSHVDIVDLSEGDVTLPLTLRSDSSQLQVTGSLDAESRFTPQGSSDPKSILSTTGRGYYIIGVVRPGHEPSNHLLRDIAALRSDIEAASTPIILLTATESDLGKLDPEIVSVLPSTVTLGYDSQSTIAPDLMEAAKSSDWPVIVVADTFNRVVYTSAGYNIGLGQKLLDVLRRL